MAPYSKPETSLKRAEELLSLSPPKEKEALDALSEVFISKRFKSTPVTALEPVIVRFLELCVTMRKAKVAKDGLGAYRNVAQSSNVGSIELVIKKFLAAATQKVTEAVAAAADAVAASGIEEDAQQQDDEDLDAPLEPSTMLLLSVDAHKDRTDRQLVLPSLRFLWECLRVCLEVLRNSARLEIVYQSIVAQAFSFCVTHSRKTEFRRLCEIIRKDLATVNKYAHQTNTINLSDPEVLTRHLETRFLQLNSAVDLELWQEAFRSVEDIQGLLSNPSSKKATKPGMMANYYEKLTKVFKAEGSGSMSVFHAAAWGRYSQFIEKVKVVEGEAAQKLAGFVLLSALAVPVMGEDGGRNLGKLVMLLNLPKMPTRGGLMKEAIDRNVLAKVAPELKQLYTLLESDFHPLSIVSSTAPLIAALTASPDFAPYAQPIRDVVVSRLFQQLSQVYDAVSIDHVVSLVAPFEISREQLEKFVMAACKRGELSVRIDHVEKSMVFKDEAFTTSGSSSSNTGNLQLSTSELVRTQLARLASLLHKSVNYIDPSIAIAAKEAQQTAIANALAQAEEERKAYSVRRAIVARRKELTEELNIRRATEEAAAREKKQKAAAEEAKKREEELFKKMQREKIQREIDQVRIDEARKLAESLKQKGGLKVDADKIDNMDTDGLVQLQVEQLEKEKKEVAERLRIISKRVDHIERAFRKEELPLVLQDYERQKAEDLAIHQATYQQLREDAQAKHEADLALKQRLARILPDYNKVKEEIMSKKAVEFKEKKERAAIAMAEEKAAYKAQVLADRAERRRIAEEEEAQRLEEEAAYAAEEERKREETARREAEREEQERFAAEKATKEAAEREQRLKEREAQREKDAELLRLRNEREAAAEAKQQALLSGRAPPAAAAASPAGLPVKAGGWRDRVATGGASASDSPSAGAYRPPTRGGSTWAPRSAASTPGATSPATSSPTSTPAPVSAPSPTPTSAPADDGFTEVRPQRYVPGRGKWSSNRGRGL